MVGEAKNLSDRRSRVQFMLSPIPKSSDTLDTLIAAATNAGSEVERLWDAPGNELKLHELLLKEIEAIVKLGIKAKRLGKDDQYLEKIRSYYHDRVSDLNSLESTAAYKAAKKTSKDEQDKQRRKEAQEKEAKKASEAKRIASEDAKKAKRRVLEEDRRATRARLKAESSPRFSEAAFVICNPMKLGATGETQKPGMLKRAVRAFIRRASATTASSTTVAGAAKPGTRARTD